MRAWAGLTCVVLGGCVSAAQAPAGPEPCYSLDAGMVDFPEGDSLALARLTGVWDLELRRSGHDGHVDVRIVLEPRRRRPGALPLNHFFYDVARGAVEIDLGNLGMQQPSSETMILLQRGDSVGAMVGSSLSVIGKGGLALEGAWDGELIRGRWWQLAITGCPQGTFELRRPAI